MKNSVLMVLVTIVLLTGCASVPKLSPLQDAIIKNDVVAVRTLLSKGADVNATQGGLLLPLAQAASTGNTEIAKLLLQKGAQVNKTDPFGRAALLIAVMNGRVDMTRLLIQNGADVNLKNGENVTPLHWASADCAAILIEHGADIHNRSKTNQVSPLMDAAAAGNADKVRLLLEKGASITETNRFKSEPLHFAANHANLDTATVLIKKGANVNSINSEGKTPLIMVIPTVTYNSDSAAAQEFRNKKSALIKLLLDNGADTSIRDKTGKTAMDYARTMAKDYNNDTYVKMLLAAPKAPPKVAIAPVPVQPAQLTPQQLAELDALVTSKNMPALKAFLDKTPVALASIKDKDLRLQLSGPAELRIVDIAALVSAKKKDALIIAQINSSGGPYKKFSLAEMEALQKLGISDEVIAAMITVTTEYNKEQKRQPAPEAPQVQSYQQAEPPPQQQDAQANECIQLALAIKACDKGSGFIPLMGGLAAEGCKAAARSKFNCSLPIEQFM